MRNNSVTNTSSWPNLVIILGGLLMAALWLLFTSLHGPTSFNKDGHFLGQDPLFWGMMMSAPASLLISLGLLAQYRLLAEDVSRKARSGFVLIIIGLVMPAIVDILTVSLGPPLLIPLFALGAFLLVSAHQKTGALPQKAQQMLWFIGVLLVLGTLSFFIPIEVLDQYQGYRIYGVLVNLLFGLAWAMFGYNMWRDRLHENEKE